MTIPQSIQQTGYKGNKENKENKVSSDWPPCCHLRAVSREMINKQDGRPLTHHAALNTGGQVRSINNELQTGAICALRPVFYGLVAMLMNICRFTIIAECQPTICCN